MANQDESHRIVGQCSTYVALVLEGYKLHENCLKSFED